MISFTFKYLKPVALFPAVAILFQGCKVYSYHKETATIDEAINSDLKRVKVIAYDGRKYEFDSIYYKNEKLYGLLVKEKFEVLIYHETIREIHLYNAKKSRGLSALLSFGIPLTIIGFFVLLYITDPPEYF